MLLDEILVKGKLRPSGRKIEYKFTEEEYERRRMEGISLNVLYGILGVSTKNLKLVFFLS